MARIAARLIAFDNARSMLDMAAVLPRERAYTNPLEPARLAAVMLLKRNPEDSTVLAHLPLDSFMERLLIGETPDKKREIAYNAFRAVDDKSERAFIDTLESESSGANRLYPAFPSADDAPVSLLEEFELFRVMYQAARCYDLNTTLQKDPSVRDKRDAVERTMRLIARWKKNRARSTSRLTIILTISSKLGRHDLPVRKPQIFPPPHELPQLPESPQCSQHRNRQLR